MKLSHALGAALALTLAMPAAATNVFIVKQGGFFNNATVNLSGPGPGNGNQIAANFRLKGHDDNGNSFDVLAFCVDLLHQINLGNNTLANINPNLTYKRGKITSAPGGGNLTTAQVQQMMGLASLGFSLIRDGDPNLGVKIPAIQAAIWSIEYGKTATSTNVAVQGWINSYIALAPSLTGRASYIFSLDTPTRQGLFIPEVPEPATWAMLIAGFGMVGYAARRRRADLASAVA
ncbi:MAG: PEPxxWA-CTERM sorting domain-containing protein [Sphingomonadaceae bacterium]